MNKREREREWEQRAEMIGEQKDKKDKKENTNNRKGMTQTHWWR